MSACRGCSLTQLARGGGGALPQMHVRENQEIAVLAASHGVDDGEPVYGEPVYGGGDGGGGGGEPVRFNLVFKDGLDREFTISSMCAATPCPRERRELAESPPPG